MSALPSPGGLVRLIITLLVATLVVLWLISTQYPQAGQRISTALAPADRSSPAVANEKTPPRKGALYIWRDERGVTQIRSEPPPGSVEAQVLPFERRIARADGDGAPQDTAAKAPTAQDLGLPLSVYSPEGFEALMQRVEETAKQLEQRNRRVEDLAEQL